MHSAVTIELESLFAHTQVSLSMAEEMAEGFVRKRIADGWRKVSRRTVWVFGSGGYVLYTLAIDSTFQNQLVSYSGRRKITLVCPPPLGENISIRPYMFVWVGLLFVCVFHPLPVRTSVF